MRSRNTEQRTQKTRGLRITAADTYHAVQLIAAALLIAIVIGLLLVLVAGGSITFEW